MPVTTLWHANLKINTDERGFNFKFHIADNSESSAKAKAISIAQKYRVIMPSSAEIFYASISKDDSKRDSRILAGCIGAGLFVGADEEEVGEYDFSRTAVLVRFEHDGGGGVTRKFCPLPDEVVYGGALVSSITAVTAVPDAITPTPDPVVSWYTEFNRLMQDIVKNTVHVEYNHAPGADYTPRAWTGAYPMRVGQKKGGRVSI